jgi:hypothetical protein
MKKQNKKKNESCVENGRRKMPKEALNYQQEGRRDTG